MSTRKPYDYMEQMRDARTDSDMKRIMRRLVRDAVRIRNDEWMRDETIDGMLGGADRIARRLVP